MLRYVLAYLLCELPEFVNGPDYLTATIIERNGRAQ